MANFLGTDAADFLGGTADADTASGLAENDTLYGADAADSLVGGTGNDDLNGNAGDDTVLGGEGDDTVRGGAGSDIVRGGQGTDVIFGDVGNDVLYGDLGADQLTGGEGLDIFVLERRGSASTGGPALSGADTILDFVVGSDQIALGGGLTFETLEISAGTGDNAGDTILRDTVTGEFLAIIKGVAPEALGAANFQTVSDGAAIAPLTGTSTPSPTPTPAPNGIPQALQNPVSIVGNAGASQVIDLNTVFGDDDPLIYSISSSNPVFSTLSINQNLLSATLAGPSSYGAAIIQATDPFGQIAQTSLLGSTIPAPSVAPAPVPTPAPVTFDDFPFFDD